MLNSLFVLAEEAAATVSGITDTGMKWIGMGIMLLVMAFVSYGEGNVCTKGVEGVSRNPEATDKIRSTMIIGTALVETCAIYTLVLAILLIFVVK